MEEKKLAVTFPSAAILGGAKPSQERNQHPRARFRPFKGQEQDQNGDKKGSGEPTTPSEATTMAQPSTDEQFMSQLNERDQRLVNAIGGMVDNKIKAAQSAWTPTGTPAKAPQKENAPAKLSNSAVEDFQLIANSNLSDASREELRKNVVARELGPSLAYRAVEVLIIGGVVVLLVCGTIAAVGWITAPAVPAPLPLAA